MAAGAAPQTQADETSSRGRDGGFPVAVASSDLGESDRRGQQFGDYELLEEIARGGMGVVYKARQKSLNRTVAVKLILAGQFATKQFVRRFRAEAAAAAVLQHPNIVAIHEVGVYAGHHFFSMDYVQGQNLAQLVGSRPLAPRQAARYIKLIAEAIDYAHQQGILHRDLKPSNVLIDAATDQPRVTDFGLARRLDGDSSLTITGQVLGSPNFMPPEQAGSGGHKLGRHSDVYGLGAILYYLVTARAPFQAESLEATVTQVINVEPIAPRLLNPAVPADLETICLRCLEKEPCRRYQTAHELAEELDRFLRQEPILARPVSRAERVWRWCCRKPALATLGGIALALLLVVLLGAPIAMVRIRRGKAEAERNLYVADMKLVSEAVRDGAYNHARELLERHRPASGQIDLGGFEWRYFWKVLQDHEPVRTLVGGLATSGWISCSLTTKGNILYNQSGSELRAWDLTTWEALPLIKPPQPGWVTWLWDPLNQRAYCTDDTNQTLTVYSLPKLGEQQVVHLPGPASTFATSPGGDLLAAAVEVKREHRVLLWDLVKGVQIAELGACGENVSQLQFSRANTILGALYRDGTLGLWDLVRLKPLSAGSNGPAGRFDFMQFLPDSRRLLLSDLGETRYRVWDISTETESILTAGAIEQMYFHGFSPGGEYLLTSVNRQELNLLDARTLQLVGTLHGHLGLVLGADYSSDGKLLATASVDQTVRLWDLGTQRAIAILGGFGERISDVKFTPDGQHLVLISGSGMLKVYDWPKVVNSGLFATTSYPEGTIAIAISPDQHTLASRAVRGTVTLWDRMSRKQVQSFPLGDPAFGNLAFAPDGKSLAWVSRKALSLLSLDSGNIATFPVDGSGDWGDVAFSPDGAEFAYACRTQLRVLDLKSQRSQMFAPSDDEVVGVDYSPDGKFVAFSDRLGSVILCDRQTRQVFKQPKVQPPHVYCVQFSPDSRLLASCSGDASIKLWTIGPGGLTEKFTLRGHVGYIAGLTFSPDGTRLATGAGDQTLKLWDVNRGVEVATLYGHDDYLGAPSFTRDGNTIYSCGFGADRQIRVWEAAPITSLDAETRTHQLRK
jgi:WD40 repeat protein/tRNA A-37 threonylcarbamoyl transferase component Bud32